MVVSNRHHGYCCGGWGREREELVGREVGGLSAAGELVASREPRTG